MEVTYRDTKVFDSKQLQQLFLSVEWESGQYPDLLVQAIQGYDSVFSAWDGDRLIGLVSTMDDGCMSAYTHYLLVNPKYQGQQIGKQLMEKVKDYYKDYQKLVLIAAEGKAPFYQKCGYQSNLQYTAMDMKIK